MKIKPLIRQYTDVSKIVFVVFCFDTAKSFVTRNGNFVGFFFPVVNVYFLYRGPIYFDVFSKAICPRF